MTEDAQAIRDDEMPLPFGVRAGHRRATPRPESEALKAIGVDPKAVTDRSLPQKHLAADESVKDPNDLKQAGWGVMLPADVPPEVMTALKPLLDRRQQQAGSLYKELGDYVPGRSARDWLNGKGVTLGSRRPEEGGPALPLAGRWAEADPVRVSVHARQLLERRPAGLRHARPTTRLRRGRGGVRDRRERAHDALERALGHQEPRRSRQPACSTTRSACHSRDGDSDHPALGQRTSSSASFSASRPRAPISNRSSAATIPTGRPALLFTGSHGVAFDSSDNAAQREGQGALLSQAWVKGEPADAGSVPARRRPRPPTCSDRRDDPLHVRVLWRRLPGAGHLRRAATASRSR